MEENQCCETEEVPRPLRAGNSRGDAAPEVQNGPYRSSAEIQPVENGFIVRVGCKTFVSQDWQEIAKALSEYWKDPAAAEKKFSRKAKD